MLTILGFLGKLFSSGIAGKIADAYKAKLNAANDKERLAADERIAHLEAQERILFAEQGNWLTRWIRPAFALPFIIYNFKVVVWDKVFGWGVTDPLSPEFYYLQGVVFGAYFLTSPWGKK